MADVINHFWSQSLKISNKNQRQIFRENVRQTTFVTSVALWIWSVRSTRLNSALADRSEKILEKEIFFFNFNEIVQFDSPWPRRSIRNSFEYLSEMTKSNIIYDSRDALRWRRKNDIQHLLTLSLIKKLL